MQVEDETYPVHKVILAASIPYFQKMFMNDFMEKNQKIVKISDINSKLVILSNP